jgi:hypothetical protein
VWRVLVKYAANRFYLPDLMQRRAATNVGKPCFAKLGF